MRRRGLHVVCGLPHGERVCVRGLVSEERRTSTVSREADPAFDRDPEETDKREKDE